MHAFAFAALMCAVATSAAAVIVSACIGYSPSMWISLFMLILFASMATAVVLNLITDKETPHE